MLNTQTTGSDAEAKPAAPGTWRSSFEWMGEHLRGYLPPMELAGLLLILLAVVVAVVVMRTWRGGKDKGTHRVRGDRDRPMTEWADEREFERQSDAEGVERDGDLKDSPRL